MSRRLASIALGALGALGPGLAYGEEVTKPSASPTVGTLSTNSTSDAPTPATPTTPAPAADAVDDDGPGEQGIGADLGIAIGGRSTPGGVRIAGHYLYRLSDVDWFDGTAAFTFGSGSADCFTDRDGDYVCEHGFLGGRAVEVTAAVRRMFATTGSFRPFARVGVGIAVVRFSDDEVTGFTIPIHAGGGVRVQVVPEVAVVAQAEIVVGVGAFGHSLGVEPQLGAGVLVGAEFRLP